MKRILLLFLCNYTCVMAQAQAIKPDATKFDSYVWALVVFTIIYGLYRTGRQSQASAGTKARKRRKRAPMR